MKGQEGKQGTDTISHGYLRTHPCRSVLQSMHHTGMTEGSGPTLVSVERTRSYTSGKQGSVCTAQRLHGVRAVPRQRQRDGGGTGKPPAPAAAALWTASSESENKHAHPSGPATGHRWFAVSSGSFRGGFAE